MVTIIFIGEDREPVHIRFSKNEELNTSHTYGKWNINTNVIELNDEGWQIFEVCRKEIRKIKPMLELLERSED